MLLIFGYGQPSVKRRVPYDDQHINRSFQSRLSNDYSEPRLEGAVNSLFNNLELDRSPAARCEPQEPVIERGCFKRSHDIFTAF